ncbi:Transcription factor IIIB 90 kDa subunit [Trichinella pseudospiralis]|uniref:B-related factor 1 n=2 Tax=Trichinella pseudospiralis TaxID=6337 RepID=A0A0V1EH74_TRIPS|nr:Transcription factor IIIB 90 kDa subunit [Trichinella pseudospiralis]KRY92679.1 Transcription factor IIIB 90 kDa subunit [Trichinella pseudospiralis]KRZ34922.1 Transcription factor IIIB 90 kDa subunit [Trichinella pseudospiralis]KRZ44069.1 Transcription factor IIIB 90 kDa subunit [Trichinella pseudospiralis]
MSTCPECGGRELVEDSSMGNSVCGNCGHVISENAIVSEVEFYETAGGGSVLLGQFIHKDGNSMSFTGMKNMNSLSSTEVTYIKVRKHMENVASQLQLSQAVTEAGFRFYKIAHGRSLTRGRKLSHVIPSLLYIACRLNGVPQMLIDFSDVAEVNVFTLGRTFSFLAREMHLKLPPTDPCIYVLRFAQKLRFGDKENQVIHLALRLIQRMKNDWMSYGRRPAGLCGAALIIAARYYGFNRTIDNVVRVVHIGAGALRKRLDEFCLTPSASFTLDEFCKFEILEQCDPPSFRRNMEKEEMKQLLEEKLKPFDEELRETEIKVQLALKQKARRRYGASSWSSDDEQQTAMKGSASVDCSEKSTTAGRLLSEGETAEASSMSLPEILPSSSSEMLSMEDPQQIDASQLNTLDDLDDDELDGYLLTPEEAALKTKLWIRVNGEFMKEYEKRKLLKEQEKEETSKGRKNYRKRGEGAIAATPGEAIKRMVFEKRLSKKINYEVLMEEDNFENVSSPVQHTTETASFTFAGEKLQNVVEEAPTAVSDIVEKVKQAEEAEEAVDLSDSENVQKRPSRIKLKPKFATVDVKRRTG